MTREYLIDAVPGERRLAVLEADQLVDCVIERDRTPALTDAIFLGRVVGFSKPLNAAFVEIGQAAPGFLPLRGETLTEGTAIVVQVRQEPVKTVGENKGARLTQTLRLAGRYAILLPGQSEVSVSRQIAGADKRAALRDLIQARRPEGAGVLLRTAAQSASEAVITSDLQDLIRQWRQVEEAARAGRPPCLLSPGVSHLQRLLRDREGPVMAANPYTRSQMRQRYGIDNADCFAGPGGLFEVHDVEDALDSFTEAAWPLPGGGTLLFAEAAAATLVDVNTGAAQAPLEASLAAAAALPLQLKLRGIGGQILVDFPLKAKSRQRDQVTATLKANGGEDVHIAGWSNLGFLELTRDREGASLSSMLQGAEAAVFQAMRVVLARRGRLGFDVSEDLAALIQGDLAVYWRALQEIVGYAPEFRVGRSLPAATFTIRDVTV
ncbi:MAG: ribonuclease E/G [Magnetospiraceae bacterium]